MVEFILGAVIVLFLGMYVILSILKYNEDKFEQKIRSYLSKEN